MKTIGIHTNDIDGITHSDLVQDLWKSSHNRWSKNVLFLCSGNVFKLLGTRGASTETWLSSESFPWVIEHSKVVQDLIDDLKWILYSRKYSSFEEELQNKKQNREYVSYIIEDIFPKKLQDGAMQDDFELFWCQFGTALEATLDLNNLDSWIASKIMWIFYTLYTELITSFENEIYDNKNQSRDQKMIALLEIKSKINNWKKSLDELIISNDSAIVSYDSWNHNQIRTNVVPIYREQEFFPERIISREFAERLKIIFELFVENYVKVIWAQENITDIE